MPKQRLIDANKLRQDMDSANEYATLCSWQILECIDGQPTVEPDDFLTVMKTSDRLCASYARCMDGCPFYNAEPNKNVCNMTKEIWEDPADFLEVIKAWAKEHPEMPCDAYNSGVCMSNGDKECSCGGDSGICEIMTKRGGIDSVC